MQKMHERFNGRWTSEQPCGGEWARRWGERDRGKKCAQKLSSEAEKYSNHFLRWNRYVWIVSIVLPNRKMNAQRNLYKINIGRDDSLGKSQLLK